MKQLRVFLIMVVIVAAPLFLAANVRAAGKNRVGLVVQYADGSVTTKCVEFEESGITGYKVLNKAGLNPIVEFSGMGAAVCKIKSDGCDYPSEACFCQCQGNPCKYWVYHHLKNGSWQYSNFGASNYEVVNGDVEGWAWGEGSPTGGLEPPIFTFDQLCGENATPTNTNIPPTATPGPPTATWTVAAPTATPTFEPPTLTATPTPQPTTGDSEIEFWADDSTISVGACATLRWETENVQAVYLDGEGVQGSGSRHVCPIVTTEYRLDVKTASGDMTRSLMINVVTAQTPTATVVVTPVAVIAAVAATPTAVLPASQSLVTEEANSMAAPSPTELVQSPSNVPVGAISLPTHSIEATPAPAGELAMVVISAPMVTGAPTAFLQATDEPSLVNDLPSNRPDSYHDPLSSSVEGSPIGYIVFSMITMGLGGWLVAAHLRRQ